MGVCDLPLMDKVCGTVDFATNPAGAVTDGIGAWIAKSMGELAASAADLAARTVNATTAIDLNASWFRENYELLLPIGLALTVGTFCIQLMLAAWRRDERALAQAAIGTMTGVLFSFCAIAFTSVAITVVDALSDGLFQAANSSVDDAIRRVVKVTELGAMYGLGWGVPAMVALGCAIGAFLYWGVMVARKVGVLVMVSLAVFAGASVSRVVMSHSRDPPPLTCEFACCDGPSRIRTVSQMFMTYFSPTGWESWGLSSRPTIPDLMPVLIDEDLRFEDAAGPRTTTVLNRWLQELPSLGCPAPSSWETYARVARDWTVFLSERGIRLFDTRVELKRGLSAYAVHRAIGPLEARFAASTWNQHMSILSSLYGWAVEEQFASAVPFTYKQAVTKYGDQVRTRPVNLAKRRMPKAHVTIKYFEEDFEDLFVKGLAGLGPDGSEDPCYRGRTTARNAAVGGFALSNGMRRQEFTYLLSCEVPAFPRRRSPLPIRVPVPAGITKGRKFRTTWTTYDAFARLHQYLRMQRALAAAGSSWRPPSHWGEPLVVADADELGGRVNGERVAWAELTPRDRRLLVAPDGGSMLLALQADGSPFLDWNTVFKRASQRIRDRSEPRFPHTAPHRCRHTFAIRTLERLVGGYYAQTAKLVKDTDADAALALYLSKTDPVMVLRDLLGHSSVLTTEVYLRRLDTTRIYRDAYTRAGHDHALLAEAEREAEDEFDEEDDI